MDNHKGITSEMTSHSREKEEEEEEDLSTFCNVPTLNPSITITILPILPFILLLLLLQW